MYWMTSNTISLVQVALMKAPGVKAYFGIPETLVEFTTTPPGVKEGSFLDNFKAGKCKGLFWLAENYDNEDMVFKVCSKVKMEGLVRPQWRLSRVFVAIFEHVSYLIPFSLLFLTMFLLAVGGFLF